MPKINKKNNKIAKFLKKKIKNNEDQVIYRTSDSLSLSNDTSNSNKSNNCNLLPYSYDFYRAEPVKVISIKISLNKNDSNIECLFYKLN